MEDNKDFYSILGVSENATKDEISKAYKKLGLKFHPDRHVNDSPEEQKRCEAEMKKINEAYATLSDDNKRREYDAMKNNPFGGAGFNPFGGGSPFGGGFHFGGGGFNPFNDGFNTPNGEDIVIDCNITLQDAFDGTEKEITYKHKVACKHCNGTGNEDKVSEVCPYCHGTGMMSQKTRTPFGEAYVQSTCPHCGGSGVGDTGSHPKCTKCNGSGVETETTTIRFKVPRGAFEGMAVSMQGKGDCAPKGRGNDGDLTIRFHIVDYCGFEPIDGTINLKKQIHVSLKESLLGFNKKFKTLDGKELNVDVKNPTANGTTLTFHSKGMPHPNRNTHYGDLFVEIVVDLPKTLSSEQKKFIEQIDF